MLLMLNPTITIPCPESACVPKFHLKSKETGTKLTFVVVQRTTVPEDDYFASRNAGLDLAERAETVQFHVVAHFECEYLVCECRHRQPHAV